MVLGGSLPRVYVWDREGGENKVMETTIIVGMDNTHQLACPHGSH